jgi:hypothetical protein
MDTLHSMLRSIRTETKASPRHLSVFREFLARLDDLQRRAPAPRTSRKPPRRKGR